MAWNEGGPITIPITDPKLDLNPLIFFFPKVWAKNTICGKGGGLNRYGKGDGEGRRTPTYAFERFPEHKNDIIIKGGAFVGV